MIDPTSTDGTPPRWYSVNNMGMATLCADQADAEMTASDCDTEWPRQAPHRAVQLVEVSALDTERTARIEAQQQLADAQELAAKAGLAHRMAVQRCVHAAVAEAVAAEREACAKACESSANGFGEETLWAAGYVQGVRDVADGIRARGEHDAI